MRLFNLILTNGRARDNTQSISEADKGGAIYARSTAGVSKNYVHMWYTTIQNSTAGQGGAVFTHHSNVSVYDSSLLNNTATDRGGAIHSEGGGNVMVVRSTVRGNRAIGSASWNYWHRRWRRRAYVARLWILWGRR